jgi:ssDNA-binding Zn-finger/Zn-ribbon topoisomerase 1
VTTIKKETKKCVLCGKTSKHDIWMSTNAFGASDLDTRPPEMERSTIFMWVQRCPHCGYCAPDISDAKRIKDINEPSEMVRGNPYQEQLKDPNYPDLANSFLCWSVLRESANDFITAGWASIHAAWVSDDDVKSGAVAKNCRIRAVALLQKARDKGQGSAKQIGAAEALLTDLLRRSGQFGLALSMCEEGLKKKTNDIISSVLRLEKELIAKKDAACHTIPESSKNDGENNA